MSDMLTDKNACSVDGCTATPVARGLCKRHYNAVYKEQQKAGRTPCREPGCYRTDLMARGLCGVHYRRLQRFGIIRAPRKTCSVEGCDRVHEGRGLCKLHYERQYRKSRKR